MSKVQDIKKSSLTFAPEAGTQRMRNVINKGLTQEDILNGSFKAFQGGWSRVKTLFYVRTSNRNGRRYERNCASGRRSCKKNIMKFQKTNVMEDVRLW